MEGTPPGEAEEAVEWEAEAPTAAAVVEEVDAEEGAMPVSVHRGEKKRWRIAEKREEGEIIRAILAKRMPQIRESTHLHWAHSARCCPFSLVFRVWNCCAQTCYPANLFVYGIAHLSPIPTEIANSSTSTRGVALNTT